MSDFFSTMIATINGEREFKFSKVFYGSELKYNVEVSDETRIVFHLYKDESGQWKIAAQRLPEWIFELEMDFNDAIEESA